MLVSVTTVSSRIVFYCYGAEVDVEFNLFNRIVVVYIQLILHNNFLFDFRGLDDFIYLC